LPPAQVTPLTAEVTSDYINLGWDQNNEEDFDHFNIYKSINRNLIVTPNTKPIQHTSHNAYRDHEIVGSITYYYRVGAVDRSGSMGPLSDQREIKTPIEHFLIWT
jgi:fibronectin type 3 domain-containing protein